MEHNLPRAVASLTSVRDAAGGALAPVEWEAGPANLGGSGSIFVIDD